jgi:RNA methyltransferase, TrmH family
MEISSLVNAKVKYVQRLQSDRRFRQREGLFVVEGTRLLTELIQLQRPIAQLFYTERWVDTAVHAQILQQITDQTKIPPIAVTDAVMAAMSDTETPAGVLAVLPIEPLAAPAHPGLILLLDGINTPGNLGTMLRTAGAAGVDLVLLSPGTVDVYNPKVVRGGMGAHLRLPIYQQTWAEMATTVAHTHIYTAAVDAPTPYTAIDWQQPSTLIIGSEAHGASGEARELATTHITIPMHKATESLNAAMAAGIILFEAARQRRT